MAPIAASMIHSWNSQKPPNSKQGLIAVSFDQRNHGSRQVDKLANDDWRHGNPRHAQDMFGTYHGTVLDTSLLMDQLPSYVLHRKGDPKIKRHFVLGISLGGHSAWQVVFSEPRVEAAVIIIGCPDYMRELHHYKAPTLLCEFGLTDA
jgi:dienelactone hydrolase